MAPIIAWAMECDRLLGIEAVKQAKQLRDGFTGRIRDAKTSNLWDTWDSFLFLGVLCLIPKQLKLHLLG